MQGGSDSELRRGRIGGGASGLEAGAGPRAAVRLAATEYARELGLTGLRGWLAACRRDRRDKARAADRPNLSG